ncbi:oligosaccharide repeat unit polymerase [Candidatus Saccharibacteria bacterium]|nr:oligosaccharide repeat unit polymerase [Candidatus Saccharibacteria bacterium]
MRFSSGKRSIFLFILPVVVLFSFLATSLLPVASVGAATTAVYVEVKISIPATTDPVRYGPVDILLYNQSGSNVGTATTGVVDVPKGQPAQDITLKDAKFATVNPGLYKICLKAATDICSSGFEKLAGEEPTAKVSVTALRSPAFINTATSAPPPSKKTCGSAVTGIGWIVCPLLTGLVKLNDGIWKTAESLLNVNPLKQDTASDSLYTAWGIIRSIANVIFVIIFLVMIFSQLTSAGISNYGVKKLLPRLIVGAIMVNLSFLFMQVIVDIANIVGSSLYDLIKGAAPPITLGWGDLLNWLLDTTVVVGAGVGAFFLAMGTEVGLLFIAPMALMALLGFLAAFLTLIFRQAAIPILAIMAPFAFLAYLLPNTEVWFKRWKDMLVSMLMMYPLSALIFGGAHFAAATIINMGTAWDLFMGLIILALPMFSMPFIARHGGALLGAVNGALNKMVEKARKPISDEFEERRDAAKARYLAGNPRGGLMGASQRWNQGRFTRKRDRKNNAEADRAKFETRGDNPDGDAPIRDMRGRVVSTRESADRVNKYKQNAAVDAERSNARVVRDNPLVNGQRLGDRKYKSAQDMEAANQDETARLMTDQAFDPDRAAVERAKLGAKAATDHAESRTLSDPSLLQIRAEGKVAEDRVEKMKKSVEATIISAGTSTPSASASRHISAATQAELQNAALQKVVATNAAEQAAGVQDNEIDVVLSTTDATTGAPSPEAVAAGGIGGPAGVAHVQAVASQRVDKRNADAVTAASIRMKGDRRVDQAATRALAMGLAGPAGTGFDGGTDPAMRQAAIKQMVASNDIAGIRDLWDTIGALPDTPENAILRNTFADSLMASGSRPVFYGAGAIEAMRINTGHQATDNVISRAIDANAYSPTKIAAADQDDLAQIIAMRASLSPAQVARLKADATTALTDPIIGPTIAKNRANVTAISNW